MVKTRSGVGGGIRTAAVLLCCAWLASCAILGDEGRPAPVRGPAPPPSGTPPSPRSTPQQGLPQPVPQRGGLSLAGHCEQREDDGFRENASLNVRGGVVQSLAWQLWVGKRGSCRFDYADFTQTKQSPHIEMTARDGSGCRLLIYQDRRRVTLAHAACQRRCTGAIYDEAWPVMFDPATGRCADLAR
ncbi:MAG: hypothetical protein AB7P21_23825 [Lautropia sp.]